MRRIEKRGLSPVIATVLLISLALILAVIIFLWAKGFVKEKAQKFGEAVELACDDIDFVAEVATNGFVKVNNVGNVPLYKIEIRKINKGFGIVKSLGTAEFGDGIPKGSAKISSGQVDSVMAEDNLIAVPIILGETESYKKPYTCAEEFGRIAEVVS